MEKDLANLTKKTEEWYKQRISSDEIRNNLSREDLNSEQIELVMARAKTNYFTKKRKRGSIIILIGCLFLLIGFVLTVFNFHENKSFTMVMYGFTSVGLLVIFAGLYDCFG